MQVLLNSITRVIAIVVGLTLPLAASAGILSGKPDNSPVTLLGEVVHATDNSFTLDYGSGQVLVEMDDWDAVPDGRAIHEGETVRVSGRVDHDFFEARKLEAGTVYVFDRNTVYTASAADEEGAPFLHMAGFRPPEGTWVDLRGAVESVGERSFVLDTGAIEVTVDTSELPYNPLDDVGLQEIDSGDLVSVYGLVDEDLFGRNEIIADTVTSYSAG